MSDIVTDGMLDAKVRGKVRINLHVHATDADGRNVYYPIHIGFFPRRVMRDLVSCINAAGLAFHSDISNQRGIVDVAVCLMLTGESEVSTWKRVEYEPPHAREGVLLKTG
jgi:hypothetical protein